MNINQILLITVLILCFFGAKNTCAQKKQDNDKVNTWEVGLDLLWLIDKNQVPATSLFGRYNFTNKKDKPMAWRLRLGVNTTRKDFSQIADTTVYEVRLFAPYLRTGLERQHFITTKTIFFYGSDISLSYTRQKTEKITEAQPPTKRLYQWTSKIIVTELIGFVGVKYSPVSWVSISIESSLNFAYRVRKDEFKRSRIDFPDDQSASSVTQSNELNVLLIPFTVINLSFNINH